MHTIFNIVKNLIPENLKVFAKTVTSYIIDLYCRHLHTIAARKLKAKKEPLNVVFFAIFQSVWKYDSLYWLMKEDKRFNPIVLVCPQVNMGRESMLKNLYSCHDSFKQRGYDVVMSYDEATDTYLDARSLNPDIILYTNPYKGLIEDRYYIDKFKDVLTCFCNYGYILIGDKWGISLPLHRRVWKYFTEYDYSNDPKMAKIKLAYQNRVPSGYPLYDEFISHEKSIAQKPLPLYKKSGKKVVIWAPHHSIEPDNALLRFSKFLSVADYMEKIRTRYQEQVFFVFKPHPLLKEKLYKTKGWGKERTDIYFASWANSINSTIVEGDYIDLFLYSDAMIHDCASFTIEYLYSKKPIMYLAGKEHGEQFNFVGQKAFECHYLYNTEIDIDHFLTKIVIEGHDFKESNRLQFYNKYLMPPNKCSVAENMLNEIVQSLGI